LTRRGFLKKSMVLLAGLWLTKFMNSCETTPIFSQATPKRIYIKSGHISVPLNALCVCLGGAPAEAVLRGMYYPGQIERR
jgi:hypothetical protein